MQPRTTLIRIAATSVFAISVFAYAQDDSNSPHPLQKSGNTDRAKTNIANQADPLSRRASGDMPDPQMNAVLNEWASLSPKPIDALTAAQARKEPSLADAALKLLKKQDKTTNQNPVADESAKKIPSPDGNIPVRVYTPGGDGPFPVIVYYHGGGFVIATIDTYESSCRALANGAKAVVVSVEYRKAPEYKYPAAHDDAFAAYKWVTENAADIKGDPKRIAVAGESAGGNLATVTAMKAAENGLQMPVFQLLVYPVTNDDMMTESYKKNADARPLNKAMMSWFFSNYASDPRSCADPHLCPLKGTKETLGKLPPAMVITAAIDPLMSEGKAYAEKLKEAGVQVEYKNYEGVTHEFFGLGALVDTAKQAEDDACQALTAAFNK